MSLENIQKVMQKMKTSLKKYLKMVHSRKQAKNTQDTEKTTALLHKTKNLNIKAKDTFVLFAKNMMMTAIFLTGKTSQKLEKFLGRLLNRLFGMFAIGMICQEKSIQKELERQNILMFKLKKES